MQISEWGPLVGEGDQRGAILNDNAYCKHKVEWSRKSTYRKVFIFIRRVSKPATIEIASISLLVM